MKIQLSDKFDYKKLLLFVLPTVAMMVFTSVYGVVDGVFVVNFVGTQAYTGLNLIMPVVMALATMGFMIGTGGSALVSKITGEGDRERANKVFSMLIIFLVISGAALTAVGEIIVPYVARALAGVNEAADETVIAYAVLYGRICIGGLIPLMLQNAFQSFFVAAEKPTLGLITILGAGVTNIVLDAAFIAGLNFGLAGAAAATVTGQVVGGVVPFIYFCSPKNKSLLHFKLTGLQIKPVLAACANGSSEMLTNISASLVSILYNLQLMKFAGNDGVAAYGTMMYVNIVFNAVLIGYSIGIAPVVSYNLGAGNRDELKNLTRKSVVIIAVCSVLMLGLALLLNRPLSTLFSGGSERLFDLTVHGFFFYSFAFLFMGFNIFSSAFFTALNNGLVSAIISAMRTLVFQIACVFVMPLILGLDGIWISVAVAEALGIFVDIIFLAAYKNRYGYAIFGKNKKKSAQDNVIN